MSAPRPPRGSTSETVLKIVVILIVFRIYSPLGVGGLLVESAKIELVPYLKIVIKDFRGLPLGSGVKI